MASAASAHPVTFDVQYPTSLSRWMWLIKGLLVLPHLLFLLVLEIVFFVRMVIAWFTVVFTGVYPRGLFDSNVAFLRYLANVGAYSFMTDIYPAFGTTPKPESPVSFDVAYPPDGKVDRLFTLLTFLRFLVMIPQILVLLVRSIVAAVMTWIGLLALLFTGTFPRGMFDFIVETQRLGWKVNVNLWFMTDVRP